MPVFSDEILASKHILMKGLWKGGKITCDFGVGTKEPSTNERDMCRKTFFKDSEMYMTHMLFEHGILVPVCSTKQVKKLEWNCIKGFAQREEVQTKKKEAQKGLGEKRKRIRFYFRKFWESIDNEH